MAAVDGEAWLSRTRMLENAIVIAPSRAKPRACCATEGRRTPRGRAARGPRQVRTSLPSPHRPITSVDRMAGPVTTDSELQTIRDLCHAVLRQNWREGVRASDGVPFAYTCPSPGRYPWQWYWDSCFTAIAGRRLDPTRAERELR